jgi:hypothetical protein
MLDHDYIRPGLVLLVVCASVATLALICVATRQPHAQKRRDECRVPLAPWLPAITTLLHMLLLMQLIADAWLVTLLFIFPGKLCKDIY